MTTMHADRKNGSRARSWALVTGASSGIGAAIAVELARRGHDVILVGRDGARLNQVAATLARDHGSRCKVFARDLTQPNTCKEILADLDAEELRPNVLVNNAGFAVHGAFTETDVERELALVDLQIKALIIWTKALVPEMVRRREGYVLNVGSVYCFFPVAWQSVYGASKAFMLAFSEALRAELYGTGVTVTVVCPGVTRTRFRKRAGLEERAWARGMEPDAVAAAACKALFERRNLIVPGTLNRFYVIAARLLPRTVFLRFARRVNDMRGLGAQP